MSHFQGYSSSHLSPDKPAEYESLYASDSWHKYLWSWEQHILDRILTEHYGGTPIKLLDFACGTGRITGFLENRVKEATGVDVSEAMLNTARQKLKRTRLIKADLLNERQPLGRERFNLITAFRFFVNAEPKLREGAIAALARFLTDDGQLVFNNHQNFLSPAMLYSRVASGLRGRTPLTTMTYSQCSRLVGYAGLRIVRVYSVGFLHLPKLNVPPSVHRLFDFAASSSSFLGRFSECPIFVCRANDS